MRPFAFTHVTVIDMTGAPPKPDMVVVIVGNQITALGSWGKLKVPKDAQVVDASGKYLIPGLWDMHAHAIDERGTRQLAFPLEIASGVTGVREMFADCYPPCVNKGTEDDNITIEDVRKWRRQFDEGRIVAPRIVASSALVDGPKVIWTGSIPVANAEEGREAVRYIKRRGNDFIKIYQLLPRDAYFAIAEEAKKQGLVFAGHVPSSITAAEASDAGQKSIEHLGDILYSCSSDEESLRTEQRAANAKFQRYSAEWWEQSRRLYEWALETYSDDKATALFARFRKNGTWQCPTLSVLRVNSLLNDDSLTRDQRLKYMPLGIREAWHPANDFRYKNMPLEYVALSRKLFRKQLEIVGAMNRSGVRVLAGTDEFNPYVYPGYSLHDELALLVEAGLTPFEALQSATRNPAEYLGKLAVLGTVEKGKLADLVLLDANPLENIKNTQKIAAVMVNGRYLPKEVLQRMLADVEALANKK